MAAYACDLDKGQQIYVEYQEPLTVITLVSGGPSQSQSQRNSFETGNWRVPPTVFQTSSSVVLRIEAEQDQHFIQVQAQGMSRLNTAPSLNDADVIPLRKVGTEAASSHSLPDMEPMEPMKPMPPMQMGDLQMGSMEMRMGNMEMRMGEPLRTETKPEPRQATKNFCNQCGSKIGEGDRFCSHCGNRIVPHH